MKDVLALIALVLRIGLLKFQANLQGGPNITIIISINLCMCVYVCMYVCGKFPSGLTKKTVRVMGLVVSV